MPPNQNSTPSNGLRNTRRIFVAASVTLIGVACAASWYISADKSIGAVMLWMLPSVLVGSGFVLYGVLSLRTPDIRRIKAAEFDIAVKRRGRLLALVFGFFAVTVSGVGALFILDLVTTFRAERFSQQKSIARLKVQQIDKWLYERAIDTGSLATSLRQLPLERQPMDPEVGRIASLMFAGILAGSSDRTAVSLIAPDGRVLVHDGENAAPDAETIRVATEIATGTRGNLGIIDVHLEGATAPKPRMGFAVPVAGESAGNPVAVVVITVDPARDLFWQIKTWPTESPSSEVELVRRQGDEVVYIMPPKFFGTNQGPLTFRLPLSTPGLLSAHAILEGDEIHEEVDYRGRKVLAASDHVVGVPWIVIAKTDTNEVMKPLYRKVATLVVLIGAAVLVASLMIFVLWRSQSALYLAFRESQAEERSALSKHFEQLIRMARDIVLLISPDGAIVEANEAAVAAYGYSAEEFRQLDIRALQAPETLADFEAHWRAPEPPAGVLVETVQRRKDGTTFPVEVSAREIEVDGKRYRQAFLRDISVRKALEKELARLARVQGALQVAGGILLRAETEAELFQKTCNAIVAMGGYRMALVAVPNQDAEKTVRFEALAGVDDGFPSVTTITWGDGPTAQGPTGRALKTGELQVEQDFAHSPHTAIWRQTIGPLRGYGSAVSLPLKASGQFFGVLTIYSPQPDAFNEEEVALLSRFADDISYGVTAIRARAAAAA